MLDLDHIGAKVAQHHRRVGPRQDPREVEYPHACEGELRTIIHGASLTRGIGSGQHLGGRSQRRDARCGIIQVRRSGSERGGKMTVTQAGKNADTGSFGSPAVGDFLNIDAQLSDGEKDVRERVRSFVHERIKPNIEGWYDDAVFPKEIVPEFAELGLLGMHLPGYGCAGKSAVEYGLACMELEAGDSGLRTFVSVQGSLAMSAIHKFGSEEQKQEWLPPMARGEKIGCFGLTEPTAGSDPASMKTFARKEGSDWVLNGEKRWIGMGTIADVAVVWARTDDGIRGFLVPTDAPGFSANDITSKLSMRASVQCDLFLQNVRLPETAILPGAEGLKGPFVCLNEARYGIIWGSMGAARSCFECALEYAKGREQFGKPIASFQLTQEKLVNMMLEVEKGTLLSL